MESLKGKRRKAVEINFEIGKFKEELAEVLKGRIGFKGIEEIVDNLELALALYYKGIEKISAKQEPCNIMLSKGASAIEDRIQYDKYDKENVAKQIIEIMKEKNAGVSEGNVRYKEIPYGGNAEFSEDVLLVVGVYSSSNENTTIKCQIYKKLILDFLLQTINNMSDFDKFSREGDAFWGNISYNFIEGYKKIVFAEYDLPEIDLVEQVSRSHYEKRECRGGVIFMSDEEPDQNVIKLDASYEWSFTNTDFVRKMLEIATEERYLFVQTKEVQYRIEGFGLKSKEDIKEQRVYIRFNGSCSYSVCSKGEEILRCENGIYYPAKEDVELSIDEICKKYNNIPGLRSILKNWNKIEHGAIFIFATDAEKICDNLCKKYKRGTVIEKFKIEDKEDFFISLSAVDGAVLADMAGNCYAYGVILDGEAKVEADLTRGSRFNSAKNYVHTAKRLAVVISEDKDRKPDIIAGWDK